MIADKHGRLLGSSQSAQQIARICMRTISLLQDFRRGDVVIALGVLWVSVCERFNVNPVDAISVANRIRYETFDAKNATQFRAIKDYMDNEL